MKAQALEDHLAQNPINGDFKPLDTFFLMKRLTQLKNWVQMYFDGAINIKGIGIGAILISPTRKYYPSTTQICFFCINNTIEYKA